jgi:hypothetical protein
MIDKTKTKTQKQKQKAKQIKNLTLEYTIFDPSTNYEGHQRSALKSNQLSGRLCATFTPSLKLIQ